MFICFDSSKGPAYAGFFQPVPEPEDRHNDNYQDEAHEELSTGLAIYIEDIEEIAGQVTQGIGHRRNPRKAQGAIGDFQIQGQDADDFTESQCSDSQIHTAQPCRRDTDDESNRSGHNTTENDGSRHRKSGLHGQDG